MTLAAANLYWIIPLLLLFTSWIIVQTLYDLWSFRRAVRRCRYIMQHKQVR